MSITVFTTIFRYLTDGVFVLTIFFLGEIVFGLDAFGEWEELILNKPQNLATLTKYSWCDMFFSESLEKCTLRIKLSDIRHVGVSQNMGLFMLPRNGKAVTFSTRGLKRDEVQNIKRDINYFLNTTRVEYLKRHSPDLGDHLLSASDSDEYLQALLNKYSCRSVLQEVPFSTCMINGQKASVDPSVHQHQSTPSFKSLNTREIFPEKSLKKRPYGSNIFFQNIPTLQTKPRSWVPKR